MTAGVTGTIIVPDGQQVAPGSRAEVEVQLQRPVALDLGMTFAVREGNRTIGAGTVIGP
ncbi:MAG: hypothetical protein GY745_19905 [Actinomycetia bacterium]|nr:hypothetical protein [Actinomycetes bacterium]MCP3910938.1 hypothetical protein [Actinomycetes bacterium]MCP4087287.1 hypothetical protein [Actinomycetes bacterium]